MMILGRGELADGTPQIDVRHFNLIGDEQGAIDVARDAVIVGDLVKAKETLGQHFVGEAVVDMLEFIKLHKHECTIVPDAVGVVAAPAGAGEIATIVIAQ